MSQAVRLTFICILGAHRLATAAAPVADEYQVKGAFLLNFAKFVEWPGQVFKSPSDPISICILGHNPFGTGLEQAANEIDIGGRPIAVRPLANPQQAAACQIVFVGSAERKFARALLQAARDASILTVGEFDGFTAGGGIIAFKLEGERVRLDINTAAAERAGLHISAKLLSLAQAGKR